MLSSWHSGSAVATRVYRPDHRQPPCGLGRAAQGLKTMQRVAHGTALRPGWRASKAAASNAAGRQARMRLQTPRASADTPAADLLAWVQGSCPVCNLQPAASGTGVETRTPAALDETLIAVPLPLLLTAQAAHGHAEYGVIASKLSEWQVCRRSAAASKPRPPPPHTPATPPPPRTGSCAGAAV